MPGNEFGERIHNFFGQEDQHQSQAVDGSWSGFSNGLGGSQRQIDPSLVSNLKSYSTQQSGDPERGQSSNSQHGLNLTQHFSTNGYMHGQAMPNEANFLGVDAEPSRDKLSARGFIPDLHKSPMGGSPVNYDFFGGQQQSNSQLPGMLQPFPRQQMTFNDMQLLKQQAMAKQMHDYQMQQQLQKQQLETRQLNYLNSNAVNGSLSSDNQSYPLINGIPLQSASSNSWQPEILTGNANWMHQGSSSGFMSTPKHGQANLLAQQFEPSLYGMPLGGANAPQNPFSSAQMNRLASQHGSANKNSALTNQPTSFLNQGDSHMVPTSTYQEKMLFSHTLVPGSRPPSSQSFQQDDSRERNNSVQEKFGRMEGSGPSEKSHMKEPENITALQKSTTLDPTEEKILFGSDDNLWEAFGSSADMSLTGNLLSSNSDLHDACPSLQSGSWSALMQSAVAETSNDDAGVHEWGSKQQSVWADNNTAPLANSSITLSERVHSDSSQTAVQHMHKRGNQVSDHGRLERPVAQRTQMAGNIFQSTGSSFEGLNNQFSLRKNEDNEDRLGIWKAAASKPNVVDLKEQNNHFTQNLQMQRAGYGIGTAGAGNVSNVPRDVRGNIQQQLDNSSVEKTIPQLQSRDGSQILESYASNNAGSNEMVKTPDVSMLLGGKETQSGHVGAQPSIPRKFQYHPMGNIDVTDDPGREMFSHFGRAKTLGQPHMNMQIDRGHVTQNDLNCTNEAFKGMGSENSPSTSASADNQMKSASPRLELLHKVDQSQEHSLETNVSGIPEATPSTQYVGQFQHSQSSSSRGFNLQLAPPSQRAPTPDNVQLSRNSVKPLNSLYTVPENGGKSQSRFACNQSFPRQSTYQGPLPGVPEESNITSGFPYSSGYHQNQLMSVATRQSASNHLVNSPSELFAPQVKERDFSDFDQRGHSAQTFSHNNTRDSGEGFPMLSVPQPPNASSSPQQSSSSGTRSDSRAGISAPQHRFWNQPSKPQPDFLRPHPLSSNNIEDSFSGQEKTNQLSSQNGGDVSLSGRDIVNMHAFQGKDMGAKQTPDTASMFSSMMQSNHQTFGGSLPSNNFPKDSFRHDEHMAGSGEDEAPKMIVKRVEATVDPQKVASKEEQQSPARSDGLVRDGFNHKESAKNMVHFGQNVSQSFSNKNHSASAGADHQQISPQMAPSWYSQYGTFKNGIVQPVNDTGRFTPLKIGEQSSNVGSSADGSHSVQSSKQFSIQRMSGPIPGAETPSDSLAHGETDKVLKVDKPKKRKTDTSGLQSWNKEVMQGPSRLKTLGEAEVDWARTTNRFPENVKFETLLEDGSLLRSKRRLIYTTQLVQQLFRPPPARVVSLVSSSNYEFVAYTAARAALGDACSSTCTDRSDYFSPPDNSNPLSERTKTEKISDQHISKAAEDFISRTLKLETDFARLENGTTIADLRVEVEDLEKFAVINRFARFHPSSSMDRTVSPVRLNSQRYVTIAPMPQNIPDRVQCLSL
ncbi:unnamed protein product [Eruca vesicaria subsp. sativa]|uniref:Dentin sialophosphoprotein-like protein n=1 Tax=Eruca vesicaria subsp. sativa TaxID=29727 RepID=A0ABC8LXE8_ERUVS|nr:unnamed protein product [Eruca vesicaria subsp. sativa]